MLITFTTFNELKKYANEHNAPILASKLFKGHWCYAKIVGNDGTQILGIKA